MIEDRGIKHAGFVYFQAGRPIWPTASYTESRCTYLARRHNIPIDNAVLLSVFIKTEPLEPSQIRNAKPGRTARNLVRSWVHHLRITERVAADFLSEDVLEPLQKGIAEKLSEFKRIGAEVERKQRKD